MLVPLYSLSLLRLIKVQIIRSLKKLSTLTGEEENKECRASQSNSHQISQEATVLSSECLNRLTSQVSPPRTLAHARVRGGKKIQKTIDFFFFFSPLPMKQNVMNR